MFLSFLAKYNVLTLQYFHVVYLCILFIYIYKFIHNTTEHIKVLWMNLFSFLNSKHKISLVRYLKSIQPKANVFGGVSPFRKLCVLCSNQWGYRCEPAFTTRLNSDLCFWHSSCSVKTLFQAHSSWNYKVKLSIFLKFPILTFIFYLLWYQMTVELEFIHNVNIIFPYL